ncbi:CFAP20 [Scenedesmus sp. PABB004]|nr:CFAP20 [Scenedesmus sp. PABB004]
MFKNSYQSGFLSILYSIGSKPLQIWDKEGAHALRTRRSRAAAQRGTRALRVSPPAAAPPRRAAPAAVNNGHIKRITDADIQSSVLEIMSANVNTTFITCPADPAATLGIKLPFLVMVIKNLNKYFSFEVTVLDDKGSTTRVKPFICTMPMRLDEGWNQIQFNLADFTRRAYGGRARCARHAARACRAQPSSRVPRRAADPAADPAAAGPAAGPAPRGAAGTNYIETLRVQVHANCRIRRIYFADRLYSEEELPPEYKLFLPIHKP